MSTNAEFVKKLRSAKTQWARFCLCDFHVHSPASYDVRKPGLYEQLSAAEQEMLKDIAIPNESTDLVAHEQAVLAAYSGCVPALTCAKDKQCIYHRQK